MELTKKQARRLILLHHNLLQGKTLKGKKGIMEFIKKMGCIQFDPLNIIAMNPHLVLQSRIKNYQDSLLTDLLYKDRLLLDGWDKNMAIFPKEDRPYLSRFFHSDVHNNSLTQVVTPYLNTIREFIEEFGPVTSKDIKINEKIDWYWAPTSLPRAALDQLFYTGELIVYKKEGSRKFYDFAYKHIPDIHNQPDPNPKEEDYHEWAILRRIRSYGLLWDKRSDAFLGIRNLNQNKRKATFKRLLAKSKVKKCSVEGIDYDFYIPTELLELLNDHKRYKKRMKFIAPLDNLMWDRKLIEALFNFNYKWEVYTPEKDRKYGYYVLPILFGDEFIGRIEPVYQKKSKTLIIKNIWLEKDSPQIQKQLEITLNEFMNFLGAETLEYK